MTSAWDYHNRTSYDRGDMTVHYLDWSSQPRVFKSYPGRMIVELPRDSHLPIESIGSVLAAEACEPDTSRINLNRLGRILFLTHAVTAKARFSGGEFYYRSVASAGALYPFELYMAALHASDLKAGIYHHDVFNNGLTLLRGGNPAMELAEGLGLSRNNLPALVFFLAAIFFRSSWKYRERAYRYHLLDSGHLAENLSLALRCDRLRFSFLYDFKDQAINELLAFDVHREACLAAVCVWAGEGFPEGAQNLDPPGPDLSACSRVSDGEIDYPAVREIHASSSFVRQHKKQMPPMSSHLGLTVDSWRKLPETGESPDSLSYAEAILHRRSMRNFVRRQMSDQAFSALVTGVCGDTHPKGVADSTLSEGPAIGLLIGNVEGWTPGFYLLDRERRAVGLMRAGFMMEDMAHICLDQAWLANCSIHFLFLTNFDGLEEAWGPRSYRYIMMQAGQLGQRIYLLATSMRIGCCGIGAFYDADAVKLLGLNDRSRLLYLVAAGVVKKWST